MSHDPTFDDIDRGPDGQLLAHSFNLNVCDSCDNAHFDLMDESGRLFCTASISPESFRSIAAFFTHAAVIHEAATGKKLD